MRGGSFRRAFSLRWCLTDMLLTLLEFHPAWFDWWYRIGPGPFTRLFLLVLALVCIYAMYVAAVCLPRIRHLWKQNAVERENLKQQSFAVLNFRAQNLRQIIIHTGHWARRAGQENCSRFQLRVAVTFPYTESRSAEVGDFLADMELNGKPSLETSYTYFLLIFCRRIRDGFRSDSGEIRSRDFAHASQEERP